MGCLGRSRKGEADGGDVDGEIITDLIRLGCNV